MMTSTWNMQGTGTCKANRTRCASDELQLDKHVEQGDYICLVDDGILMVISRWKDSNTLQIVSIIMESGKIDITWCMGQGIITFGCWNDTVICQEYMDDVDNVDKTVLWVQAFQILPTSNSWYKKSKMGVNDFQILNAFAALNSLVDELKAESQEDSTYGYVSINIEDMQWITVLLQFKIIFISNNLSALFAQQKRAWKGMCIKETGMAYLLIYVYQTLQVMKKKSHLQEVQRIF
eukprot:11997095-Ditylum_brightwellii.AAC.1